MNTQKQMSGLSAEFHIMNARCKLQARQRYQSSGVALEEGRTGRELCQARDAQGARKGLTKETYVVPLQIAWKLLTMYPGTAAFPELFLRISVSRGRCILSNGTKPQEELEPHQLYTKDSRSSDSMCQHLRTCQTTCWKASNLRVTR